jgi:hypothetical protein
VLQDDVEDEVFKKLFASGKLQTEVGSAGEKTDYLNQVREHFSAPFTIKCPTSV